MTSRHPSAEYESWRTQGLRRNPTVRNGFGFVVMRVRVDDEDVVQSRSSRWRDAFVSNCAVSKSSTFRL